MVAHAWTELREDDLRDYGLGMRRRCTNCGKIQRVVKEHAWMRVVETYWWPKAGRCQVMKEATVVVRNGQEALTIFDKMRDGQKAANAALAKAITAGPATKRGQRYLARSEALSEAVVAQALGIRRWLETQNWS